MSGLLESTETISDGRSSERPGWSGFASLIRMLPFVKKGDDDSTNAKVSELSQNPERLVRRLQALVDDGLQNPSPTERLSALKKINSIANHVRGPLGPNMQKFDAPPFLVDALMELPMFQDEDQDYAVLSTLRDCRDSRFLAMALVHNGERVNFSDSKRNVGGCSTPAFLSINDAFGGSYNLLQSALRFAPKDSANPIPGLYGAALELVTFYQECQIQPGKGDANCAEHPLVQKVKDVENEKSVKSFDFKPKN